MLARQPRDHCFRKYKTNRIYKLTLDVLHDPVEEEESEPVIVLDALEVREVLVEV